MKPHQGWDKLIDDINKDMEEALRIKKALSGYEPSFKCELVVSSKTSRLVIYSLNDLNNARSLLREAFGHWEDRLSNRFFSQGITITTWEDKRLRFQIWLEIPPQEYPQQLLKDGCRWKEVDDMQGSEYRLVCDNKGDSDANSVSRA